MLFGTDDEPFLIYVDHQTLDARLVPCPLSLRLKNYQGICKLPGNEVFIGGGINKELKKIFMKCKIFDIETMKVRKCPDMISFRYTFPTIFCNGYVYVVGGRKYGVDKNAVTSDCERLNLKTMKWQQIKSLNYRRCTGMIYTHKDQIYIAGGYSPEGQRLDSIEVYEPSDDLWYCLGMTLSVPLEAALVVKNDTDLFLLAGR